MADKAAVVWTRAVGTPRKLGLLVLAGGQVRFSYQPDARDLPGVSVLHDVARLGTTVQGWPSTEENPLPPMFQALVPPREGNNLQRRLLMRVLERQGRHTVAAAVADPFQRRHRGVGHGAFRPAGWAACAA